LRRLRSRRGTFYKMRSKISNAKWRLYNFYTLCTKDMHHCIIIIQDVLTVRVRIVYNGDRMEVTHITPKSIALRFNWTPEKASACQMLAEGISKSETARQVGKTRSTIVLWARHPIFKAEFQRLVLETSAVMSEQRLMTLQKVYGKLRDAFDKRDFKPADITDKDLVKALIEINQEVRRTSVEVRGESAQPMSESDRLMLKKLREMSVEQLEEKAGANIGILKLIKSKSGRHCMSPAVDTGVVAKPMESGNGDSE